jgi:hypothetical protein
LGPRKGGAQAKCDDQKQNAVEHAFPETSPRSKPATEQTLITTSPCRTTRIAMVQAP